MSQKSSKSGARKKNGKRKDIRTRSQPLTVVNSHAAGIDVGSASHYAAVPAQDNVQSVREFGCLTPELHEMAQWLKSHAVDTVAMESTGVYWVPVAQVLESHGLRVLLVDARQVRNVSGRKTDVQDCQWIQQLHSYGLLAAAFRPASDMEILRNYWRQREWHVQACSQQILRMQKSLEQMNIQLHKVLSDITGATGMRMLRAIVCGERDPEVLVQYCHPLCKRPPEDFIKALTGNYREDHLFALQQALELYDVFHEKLRALDLKMHTRIRQHEDRPVPKTPGEQEPKRASRYRRNNDPHFDLKGELVRLCGVDLTHVEGIDAITAYTVVTEQGIDMSPFPTEKHFASHLGLCPNNQITGGKIRKRKTRKVQSRAAKALRVAAQSLHHSDSALGAFYRRMKARHGPAKAITATAHKLAKLIYRMLKYGEDYVDKGAAQYESQYREQKLSNLVKQARRMGYELLDMQTGEVLS